MQTYDICMWWVWELCYAMPTAGLTPVHVATKEANIEVLKFLFQMGTNKNSAVRTNHVPS